MKDVVSSNKPPPIKGGPPEAVFPRSYDFEPQRKVHQTWNRLNAEIEYTLPVLLRHLDDNPYSFTAQQGNGCDYHYSVGDICRHIIERHMSVSETWLEGKGTVRFHLGPLADWRGTEFGSFDWAAEVKKLPNGRNPSLFDLQVKAFDWAIRQQQLLPARQKNQQAVVMECLRRRRNELLRSGRPILCSPWGGFLAGFVFNELHIRGEESGPEKKRKRKLAKAMRDQVSRLASPNQRPKIVKDKVVQFPKGYDRTAQEGVVRAVRTLNKNIEAALSALVAGVKDKRYCVTVEGANGMQRNLTVGKLCGLLLAANVNIYRPYIRSLDGPDSYPMYLRPSPSSVAKWWKKKNGNSLTITQRWAFKWALQFEKRQGASRQEHEDVQWRYLNRKAREHLECDVPIVVDLLKTERVVLPKGK
jgi:hypothetical protein